MNYSEVIGNESAKRAIEVAATGMHAIALYGGPGSGKSMLAERSTTITPDEDSVDVRTGRPCACGYYGDPVHKCYCTMDEIQCYRTTANSELFECEMVCEVCRLPVEKLIGYISKGLTSEDSAAIAERVAAAREIQTGRNPEGCLNADLSFEWLRDNSPLDNACIALLTRAMERLGLNTLAVLNVYRVARSIADLDGCKDVEVPHLAEAIQYRAGAERLRA